MCKQYFSEIKDNRTLWHDDDADEDYDVVILMRCNVKFQGRTNI